MSVPENPTQSGCLRPPTHAEQESTTEHPLGPLVHWVPLDGPIAGRLYAAGVLAVAVAILAVAARLDPTGLHQGVHQQLGFPPCGFVSMTGLPCPTCGMTTAFAHAVRGQVWEAAKSQLAGLILAFVTMLAGVFSAAALMTGKRPTFNWYRINPVSVVWIGCILFVAAWGVRIVLYHMETRASGSGS